MLQSPVAIPGARPSIVPQSCRNFMIIILMVNYCCKELSTPCQNLPCFSSPPSFGASSKSMKRLLIVALLLGGMTLAPIQYRDRKSVPRGSPIGLSFRTEESEDVDDCRSTKLFSQADGGGVPPHVGNSKPVHRFSWLPPAGRGLFASGGCFRECRLYRGSRCHFVREVRTSPCLVNKHGDHRQIPH